MEKHNWSVHIVPVGFNANPINVVNKYKMNIDKMYLLYGNNVNEMATLGGIERDLTSINAEFEKIPVDPFDFDDILNAIMCCVSKEKKIVESKGKGHIVEFFMNITNGTRLMTGATTVASYLVGSSFYYVMDTREERIRNLPVEEQIKVISTPKIVNFMNLKDFDRKLLKFIAEKEGGTTYSEMVDFTNKSHQNLTYHVERILIPGNIVTSSVSDDDKKTKIIKVTPQGKLLGTWL